MRKLWPYLGIALAVALGMALVPYVWWLLGIAAGCAVVAVLLGLLWIVWQWVKRLARRAWAWYLSITVAADDI